MSQQEELLPLTVPEVRRLLHWLVWVPLHPIGHVFNWSRWRRRHQARAKRFHYRKRLLNPKPLKIQGIVTDKNIIDGEAQLECDVYMENEEGTRLVIGKATVVLPARELLE